MNQKIKISQLPAKGANLDPDDLLEIAEFTGTGYVSKSITGQEIIDAATGAGVTAVTATAPLISTGGTTPDISMPAADVGNDGYLSAGDYNAFNNKQDALTLTTTGTSGAATLVGSTLNIPQYSVGGGASGIHGAFIRSGVATTYMINSLTSYTATASSNLRLSAVPFLPNKTFTTSSFYINCGTFQAGALARILIYSDLNGLPDQKLYESANLDLSTNGVKTATTSFTFTAGTNYFICTHTQGTATLTNIPAANLYPISIAGISNPVTQYTAQVSYPLGSAPTTFGSVNLISGSVILVGITSA